MSTVNKYYGYSTAEIEEAIAEQKEQGEGKWTYDTNSQHTKMGGVLITYVYKGKKLILQGKAKSVEETMHRITCVTQQMQRNREGKAQGTQMNTPGEYEPNGENHIQEPQVEESPDHWIITEEDRKNRKYHPRHYTGEGNEESDWERSDWAEANMESEQTEGFWDENLKDVVLYHKGRRNPKMCVNPMIEKQG